ncbi:hypothetical protein [Novosphingopyxis iocasae]|uniref:hypothetical protein n=1 Tax=Novosphingopyxis iocasae TaxID=2762729 RepID=UPI0031B606BF|tara:strand:+ start:324 stop:560 length:237 start_codon:yes stop_codon:yes gene_type:complete
MSLLHRILRLFIVKSRAEVFLITFGLALGATQRGATYVQTYPGWLGWIMFGCCCAAVFMAGAKMLQAVDLERERDGLS